MSEPRDDFADETVDPLKGEFPASEERAGRASFVPEFVRKVAVAGLGALFMTEEGIRSLAGQLKLPKEMLSFIVSQAEKTKDEIGRVITEELRNFLRSDLLRNEFLKLLTAMTIEIKAEVRLVPDPERKPGQDAPATPRVSVSEIGIRKGRSPKSE